MQKNQAYRKSRTSESSLTEVVLPSRPVPAGWLGGGIEEVGQRGLNLLMEVILASSRVKSSDSGFTQSVFSKCLTFQGLSISLSYGGISFLGEA